MVDVKKPKKPLVRIDTKEKKYWNQWRNYKTMRGARAYAKKHSGWWFVIEMNPKLLTAQERRDLGNWVVGRADEYMLYASRHEDFVENYPTREVWFNGKLVTPKEE